MTLAWIAKDHGLIPIEALVFYPNVTFVCVYVCVVVAFPLVCV